jgi:hypothetical protein
MGRWWEGSREEAGEMKRSARVMYRCHADTAPKRTLERYVLHTCLRLHQEARSRWVLGRG